jgi:hypothetical protein
MDLVIFVYLVDSYIEIDDLNTTYFSYKIKMIYCNNIITK